MPEIDPRVRLAAEPGGPGALDLTLVELNPSFSNILGLANDVDHVSLA
jgi:hypothetical protein